MKWMFENLKNKLKNSSIQFMMLSSYIALILLFFVLVSYLIHAILVESFKEQVHNRVDTLHNSLIAQNTELIIGEMESYGDLMQINGSVQYLLEKEDVVNTQSDAQWVHHSMLVKQESQYYSVVLNRDVGFELYNNNCEQIVFESTSALVSKQTLDEFHASDLDRIFVAQSSIKDGKEINYLVYLDRVRSIVTGKRIGTVAIYLEESYIWQAYFADEEQDSGIVYMSDKNGVILSASHENLIGESVDRYFFDQGDFVRYQNEDLFMTSQNLQNYDLTIVNLYPTGAYREEISDLQNAVVLVGIACTAVAVVFAFLLSKTISLPIKTLLQTTKSVRKGQRGARVNFRAKNELGELAKSFDEMLDTIDELIVDISEQQNQKKELEVRLVQAQIKPHFLYNILENIASYIKINEPEVAISLVHNLADFYRESLGRGEHIITLEQELRLSRSYLDIQTLRYTPILSYKIEQDESLHSCLLPKFTLQPLIENAIYHGIKESPTGGEVCVSTRREGDQLILEVFDNGKGMDKHTLEKLQKNLDISEKEGFGVASVQHRIKLMYGDNYGLKIESEQNKFSKFTINLPMCFGEE